MDLPTDAALGTLGIRGGGIDEKTPKRRGKKPLYVVGSAVVSISVFAFLFSYISIGEVASLLSNAYIPGLLMFVGLSFVMSFLRAWRYLILLRLSGYSPHVLVVYLVVLVGNFFSDLLPARTGSLIYVFLITKRLSVPFAAAASSFAIAFLFDLLSLAPILFLVSLGSGAIGSTSVTVLIVSGLFVTLLSVILLKFLPEFCSVISRKLPSLPVVPTAAKEKFAVALVEIQQELALTQRANVYARLFYLSALIRLIKYGAQYMALFGLLQPLGYAFENLDVFKVFFAICASESAASLPFAGIAGFGIFEGTWAFVFEYLGFPGQIAKLTSISLHLSVQVYGYVLGVVALGVLLLPLFGNGRVRTPRMIPQESAWNFYSRIVALSILTLFAVHYFVVHY